jgi:hypothetical protein
MGNQDDALVVAIGGLLHIALKISDGAHDSAKAVDEANK